MRGNVPPLVGKAARVSTARVALLALPTVALLGLFVYWPLVRTLYLSVHGVNLFGQPIGFVGLRYYIEYFTDSAERSTLLTTLLFSVLSVGFTLVPALVLTLLLGGSGRGGAIARTVFSLPFAYSAGSASVLFAALYNPATGVLNQVLGVIGVGPVSWLGGTKLALVSVAAATAWWQLGFAVLVLTAAIRAVPEPVIEAARLDGAGRLRLVRSIILPLISPSVFFLLVTDSVSGVQTFTQIALLTRGGPSGSTTTLVYDFYQRAFGNGEADYGRASTIAIILVLLVIAITAFQFRVLERKVHY